MNDLISCLSLETTLNKPSLESSLNTLLHIPGTFTGLAWQFDHDFLYMSPGVVDVLGYPMRKFKNSGVMFLHSITPKDSIESLYETINAQLAEMESGDFVREPYCIEVRNKLVLESGEEAPNTFIGLPLDYRPGVKNSYLILGTQFLNTNRSLHEIDRMTSMIRELFASIKHHYIKMNPTRFNYLEALSTITQREVEIAVLLCQGFNTRQIADKLFISHNTVDTHRKNLLSKFEARNTTALIHQLSPYISNNH